MPAERQALILLILACWVAVWWLAVRAIFGRRFGFFEWAAVGALAFAFPLLVSGVATVYEPGHSDELLLAAWGGTALLIDFIWGVRWIVRRRDRRRT